MLTILSKVGHRFTPLLIPRLPISCQCLALTYWFTHSHGLTNSFTYPCNYSLTQSRKVKHCRTNTSEVHKLLLLTNSPAIRLYEQYWFHHSSSVTWFLLWLLWWLIWLLEKTPNTTEINNGEDRSYASLFWNEQTLTFWNTVGSRFRANVLACHLFELLLQEYFEYLLCSGV